MFFSCRLRLSSLRTTTTKVRYFTITSSVRNVRVRFAPSPTGQLHIGGFRTALYNYLFAKSKGGKFILRIEDTDQTRVVPGAQEKLIDLLDWAGIIPDESPFHRGDHGPYVQSQRLDLYREAVSTLIKNGKAYRCFCSERRLDILRKEAARTKSTNKYDGRCRNLDDQEVQKRIEEGQSFTVRLKVEDEDCAKFKIFNDAIFGEVKHGALEAEGDPIIFKSDGFPVYHLANVVDDHHMGITHVFRGVEWQVSTPKHLMLYNAFGWQPPVIGHLPLVMNADGTKLSKRQGDVHLEEYKANGYYPEAVINFITLCGGGFHDRDVLNDIKALSTQQLVERFDYELMKTNSTRLDFERLNFLNQQVIQNKLNDPQSAQELVDEVKIYLKEFTSRKPHEFTDDATIMKHLQWLGPRIHRLSELTTPNYAFLWAGTTEYPQNVPWAIQMIQSAMEAFDHVGSDFSAEAISQCVKDLAAENQLKAPEVMRFYRSILSGLKQGPPIGEMIHHLGHEETQKRLRSALKHYS